jgi:hypothetical protein
MLRSETMHTSNEGGCACGAIRYRFSGDPLFAVNCHCRDCQRETGSAFAPILGVAAAGFELLRGEPRFHDLIANSGFLTRRAFCSDCGSRLYGLPQSNTDLVTIRAGSLDAPSIYRPTADIFVSRAQPWDAMDPALPKVAELR